MDRVIDSINEFSSSAESADPVNFLVNLKSSLVDVGTVEESSAAKYQVTCKRLDIAV